jgi:hypothetical protein
MLRQKLPVEGSNDVCIRIVLNTQQGWVLFYSEQDHVVLFKAFFE